MRGEAREILREPQPEAQRVPLPDTVPESTPPDADAVPVPVPVPETRINLIKNQTTSNLQGYWASQS